MRAVKMFLGSICLLGCGTENPVELIGERTIATLPGAFFSAYHSGGTIYYDYISGTIATGGTYKNCDLSPHVLVGSKDDVVVFTLPGNNRLHDAYSGNCGFIGSWGPGLGSGTYKLRVIHSSAGNDLSATVIIPPPPTPPTTCELTASPTIVPSGSSTRFSLNIRGSYPVGSLVYFNGTKNGVVDAVDEAHVIASGWTVDNTPGLEGRYKRVASIKDPSGRTICTTDTISIWFQPEYSSPVLLKNNYAGKCLTVGSASRAVIWECNGSAAQKWSWGTDNSIVSSGKCLDVTRFGRSNGTLVQVYECNGSAAQVWVQQADGSLMNPNSGKCLDDLGYVTTSGTQMGIWDCSGASNQQWLSVP